MSFSVAQLKEAVENGDFESLDKMIATSPFEAEKLGLCSHTQDLYNQRQQEREFAQFDEEFKSKYPEACIQVSYLNWHSADRNSKICLQFVSEKSFRRLG